MYTIIVYRLWTALASAAAAVVVVSFVNDCVTGGAVCYPRLTCYKRIRRRVVCDGSVMTLSVCDDTRLTRLTWCLRPTRPPAERRVTSRRRGRARLIRSVDVRIRALDVRIRALDVRIRALDVRIRACTRGLTSDSRPSSSAPSAPDLVLSSSSARRPVPRSKAASRSETERQTVDCRCVLGFLHTR